MASSPVKGAIRQVRPLLSTNREEARRTVLNLFKQWCRSIEHMNLEYELPLSYDEATKKIKSEFLKHKDLTDIRVIDMLVLKSRNELDEINKRYKFVCQFYYKYKDDDDTQPKDFLKKFLSSSD